MERAVSVTTTILVFILALLAFVLSYNALQAVAASNGIPTAWYLSHIWPLLVDFALVVFSLGILRASLLKEKTFWYWAAVVLFAITTIGFNLVHAPANPTARIVALVPPIALLMSFETLMSMVRSNVRRGGAIRSLEETQTQAEQARQELEQLNGAISAKRAELEAQPRRERKPKAAQAKGQPVSDTKARARQIVDEQPDITGAALARALGVSGSRGRVLLKELQPESPNGVEK